MFHKIAVIGAGTMGRGIALVMAWAKIPVILIDTSEEVLGHAQNYISSELKKSIAKGKLSPEKNREILQCLSMSETLSAMDGADLIIEAITEDMAQKIVLFQLADQMLPPYSILASNTSSLSIHTLATATKRPEKVIGLHFFNPAHIMKLLEIVVTQQTSAHSLERAHSLAHLIQKEAIIVQDSPGFATSRLGICLALECIRMLEQKVAGIRDLDTAMALGYGHPMGPLMLTDYIGLDVRLAISEHLFQTLGSPIFEPPKLLYRLCRQGLLGKKSGEGFYVWEDNKALGLSQIALQLIDG